MIENLLLNPICTIRQFAKFIGNLNAACPSVPYGNLYCKKFERAKFLALLFDDGDYDKLMRLETYLHDDLFWWQRNIIRAKKSFEIKNFDMEIFSDASLTGWGAASGNENYGGF